MARKLNPIEQDPETGDVSIPSHLLDLIDEVHPTTKMVRIQAKHEDSYRYLAPKLRFADQPPNNTPEEIAYWVVNTVHGHAVESGTEMYKCHITLYDKHGRETVRSANLKIASDSDGMSVNDATEPGNKNDTYQMGMLKEMMAEAREDKAVLMNFITERESRFAETLTKLGEGFAAFQTKTIEYYGLLPDLTKKVTQQAVDMMVENHKQSEKMRQIDADLEVEKATIAASAQSRAEVIQILNVVAEKLAPQIGNTLNSIVNRMNARAEAENKPNNPPRSATEPVNEEYIDVDAHVEEPDSATEPEIDPISEHEPATPTKKKKKKKKKMPENTDDKDTAPLSIEDNEIMPFSAAKTSLDNLVLDVPPDKVLILESVFGPGIVNKVVEGGFDNFRDIMLTFQKVDAKDYPKLLTVFGENAALLLELITTVGEHYANGTDKDA